jgi:hypothetical protein
LLSSQSQLEKLGYLNISNHQFAGSRELILCVSELLELSATDNQSSILFDSLSGLSMFERTSSQKQLISLHSRPRLEPWQSFAKSICAEIQSRNYLI